MFVEMVEKWRFLEVVTEPVIENPSLVLKSTGLKVRVARQDYERFTDDIPLQALYFCLVHSLDAIRPNQAEISADTVIGHTLAGKIIAAATHH
jgi:hypothetical protein